MLIGSNATGTIRGIVADHQPENQTSTIKTHSYQDNKTQTKIIRTTMCLLYGVSPDTSTDTTPYRTCSLSTDNCPTDRLAASHPSPSIHPSRKLVVYCKGRSCDAILKNARARDNMALNDTYFAAKIELCGKMLQVHQETIATAIVFYYRQVQNETAPLSLDQSWAIVRAALLVAGKATENIRRPRDIINVCHFVRFEKVMSINEARAHSDFFSMRSLCLNRI
jgi:hypothetical protein